MASLLAGIVFVPKSKRQDDVDDISSKTTTASKSDRKRDAKHDNNKKISKKMKSHSISSSSQIEEIHEPILDHSQMGELLLESISPPQSDRMSWMLQSKEDCKRPSYDVTHTVPSENSKERYGDQFQSLMGQLSSEVGGEVKNENSQERFEPKGQPCIPQPLTNQTMATILRERLKSKKGVLKSADSTETRDVVICVGGSNSSSQIGREILKSRTEQHQTLAGKKEELKADSAKGSRRGKMKNSVSSRNDDKADINSLVVCEKLGGDDMDAIYMENILRLGERYKGTELGAKGVFGKGDKSGADEDDGDHVDFSMFQRLDDRLTDAALRQRQVQRAISEKKRHHRAVDNCGYCIEGPASKQFAHLVICSGEHIVLRLKPHFKSLSRFHCEIIPISHSTSIRNCEEEIIREVDRFKSCLYRTFEREKLGVIFLESAVHFSSMPHACIDVVPVAVEVRDDARVAFKEALASCDEEWSQHKKVIDLTTERPLSRAVPQQFQYLAVEWGDDCPIIGAAHVVENESSVNRDFCLDVVAGILDVDPQRMRGKRSTNSVDIANEKKDRDELALLWEPFDWTKYIE